MSFNPEGFNMFTLTMVLLLAMVVVVAATWGGMHLVAQAFEFLLAFAKLVLRSK